MTSNLKEMLSDFIQLLKTEKAALIRNDGEKIEELLVKKEDFVQEIEKVNKEEIDAEDKELIELISEVKEQQETNLLLTQQAMSHAQTFISAFQKEAQKDITYSKGAKKTDSGQASILNQSL